MTPTARSRRVLLIIAIVVGLGVAAYVVYRPSGERTDPLPNSLPPIGFTDVTEAAGIRFRHASGAAGNKLLPETMGSGVAVLDFDGDGRPDLFFVNSCPWPGQPSTTTDRPTQALYRNRGDGTFEDVTAAVGLAVELYGMGVAVGDFDNDGWPDLFVTAVGGNRLFRNLGGKSFVDVTTAAGLGVARGLPAGPYEAFLRHESPISFPSSAVFLDYDGDGRLDLFVCNYLTWSPATDLEVKAILPGGGRAYVPPQYFPGAQCVLWRNVDGTRFEDVSEAAGVRVSEPGGANRPTQAVGKSLGVAVCDVDGDGWPDVVVANDTVRNFFFHNRPAPGGSRQFEETGMTAGLAYADGRPRGGMGVDTGTLAPDLFAVVVANFSNEPNSLFRRVTANPPRFADAAQAVGLDGPSRVPMKFGAIFFDCDRDGRLDLFTCNGHLEPDITRAQPGQSYAQRGQLFWNTGRSDALLALVPGESFPAIVGRGCAFLDYDGDGDLDLILTDNNHRPRLLRNDTPGENRSLRLTLTGTRPGTNRSAIGADMTVTTGDLVQRRYVTAARGYLSQSELTVTVGVGTATTVNRVTVRWPGRDGGTEVWTGLAAGRSYELVEGDSQARPGR